MRQRHLASLYPYEVLLHALFWPAYFLFPLLKFAGQDWFQFNWPLSLLNLALIASTVYTTYFLLARLLKRPLLFVPLLVFFAAMVYCSCHFSTIDCNCSMRACLISKAVEFAFVNLLFVALHMAKNNLSHQQALQKSEAERIQAELNGLKAQINPHFLFNTLNMLYAEAIESNEALADKIMKLADNLHYMLHEGNKQTVTLQKEIAFLTDYIALQQGRLANKVAITFDVQVPDPAQQLPPLLLIPLVENAFKYTSTMGGTGLAIYIGLQVKARHLQLEIRKTPKPQNPKTPKLTKIIETLK